MPSHRSVTSHFAPDLHARRLRAFDQWSVQFERTCRRRVEAGHIAAREEIDSLTALADSVVSDVEGWRERLDALELSRSGGLDIASACEAIAQVLADEVLEPEAAGVFAAALEIAVHG